MNFHIALTLFAAATICSAGQSFGSNFEKVLFKSGDMGSHTFRIPAVERCSEGVLAAFAEARKDGAGDSGRISIAMRSSEDGGKTWTPAKIVVDGGDEYSCGNPVPVFEKKSGDLILIYNKTPASDTEQKILSRNAKGVRRTFLMRSADGGKTWGKPREITGQVKTPEQTWFAVGPSGAIQIEGGKYDGRIVCPVATATFVPRAYWAAAFYSDDGAMTWKRGDFVMYCGANESQIAQIDADTIAINMRVQGRNPDGTRKTKYRLVAMSKDGGKTWGNPVPDAALPEPVCEGSFASAQCGDRRILAFSNPADESRRVNMTIRFAVAKEYACSFNEGFCGGSAWKSSIALNPRASGYSDIVFIDENTVGVVYERGTKSYFDEIVFSLVKIPR